MKVATGVIQRAQGAWAPLRPELSRPFETALALAAGPSDGSAANEPAAISDLLVVHSPSVTSKIILLFAHRLTGRAAGHP